MNESNGWRECADPVELAAAVAAGVEVQYQAWHQNYYATADEFAASGLRYRVPASWSWSYEPPAPVTGDDLRERIARAIWEDDVVNDRTDARQGQLPICYYDNADAALAVLPPQPAPPPVPPWPGAVLSGLCDEDGVPTWLAQAGQVRGEQVRGVWDAVWLKNVRFQERAWVEVRAPRAVPEPDTERVPWWEAVGRECPQGGRIISASKVEGACTQVSFYGGGCMEVTRTDGTVEVLKDGDR